MKEIYLVQALEHLTFKECARKGIKVETLEFHGIVSTLWCDSKMNAIKYCREQNSNHNFLIYFVRRIKDYTK